MKSIFSKIVKSDAPAPRTVRKSTPSSSLAAEHGGTGVGMGERFYWVRSTVRAQDRGKQRKQSKSAKASRNLVTAGTVPKNIANSNNEKLKEFYGSPRVATLLKESNGLEWNLLEFVKLGSLSSPVGTISPLYITYFMKNLSTYCSKASLQVRKKQKDISDRIARISGGMPRLEVLVKQIEGNSEVVKGMAEEIESMQKDLDDTISCLDKAKDAVKKFELPTSRKKTSTQVDEKAENTLEK